MLLGKKAPNFTAQAVINGQIKNISLEDYKDKYKVIFFYPLDFTFVCPTEILAFQDKLKEFEKKDCVVLGISVDSVFSHLAWTKIPRDKGGISGIEFPLISDLTKDISKSYDVLKEDEGVAFRAAFILDKNNTVQSIYANNLSIGRNVNEVLRLLEAIQFTETHGELCPVNWQPGQPGIKPN